MPITEFSLLHFDPSVITLEELKPILRDAKDAMESFSNYPFHYYIQASDDVTYIYIIGAWDSLEQHYDEWIVSDVNKDVLKRLKGKVDVEWLFHLSLDYTEDENDSPFGAPVISISRFFAEPGQREAIDEAIVKNPNCTLDIHSGERCVSYGWRLDLGFDKDEIRDVVKCAPPVDEICLFTDLGESIFSTSEATERRDLSLNRRALSYFSKVDTKQALKWDV